MDAQELEQKERELAARELRISALETLNGKGLPAALANLLDYGDAEKCKASLEAAEQVFRDEVRRQVDARLGKARTELPGAGVPDEDRLTDKEYYALKLRG